MWSGLTLHGGNAAGGGGAVTAANNGLVITGTTVQQGGAFIQNTDFTGSFFLGYDISGIVIGDSTAAAVTGIPLFVKHQPAEPLVDGTSGILSQTIVAPTVNISRNITGSVGTLSLDLTNAIVNDSNIYNSSGILGSLVLENNNGSPSTRRLRANMAALNLLANVNVNDIALFEAKTVEVTGGGNTVTNCYGLYIGTMKATGVTTGWGVYQSASTDDNHFAGRVAIGTTSFPSVNTFLNVSNSATNGEGARFTVGNSGFVGFRTTGGSDTLNIRLQPGTNTRLECISATAFAIVANGAFPLQLRTGGSLQMQDNTGASTWLTVTNDGRLFGSALHNNAGAVTGTTNQYIASGTYTPTLTNVTNVAASTAYQCQWMRVGNVVTVSGKVDIDATAAAATELGISLPIASNFTAEENCGGVAASDVATTPPGRIRADATNDRAAVVFTATTLSNDSYNFTFTYLIL